jgi:SAM-dependent methyltransferase
MEETSSPIYNKYIYILMAIVVFCVVGSYLKKRKTEQKILAQIHDEPMAKYYGCGLVVPHCLQSAKVLDLGCGAGRDVFIISKLVGEKGDVVGVDFTDEQIASARKHQEWHREKFAHSRLNTQFLQGDIQELLSLKLAANSFDIVVSNCVVNLVEDKLKVLKDVFTLLKDGGEFYFSDVYASRRISDELQRDPVARGECLSGALYWNDFHQIAKAAGFRDPRIVESRQLSIGDEALAKKLAGIEFFSVTYRLFKLPKLEPACEDYGQAVIYNGGIQDSANAYLLDGHHLFEKGKIVPVCGNTWMMLADTRLKDHFTFIGNFEKHFGIFPGCGTDIPYSRSAEGSSAAAACCP